MTPRWITTVDVAIVATRRQMLNAIRGVQEGRDPPGVIRSDNENVFNDLLILAQMIDKGVDPRQHCASIVQTRDYHALKN